MKTVSLIVAVVMAFLISVSAAAKGADPISKTQQLEQMFTSAELMDATVAELLEAMKSGRLTSEKLCRMYLERIETYDKSLKLNSIISINPEALSEAIKADEMMKKGKSLGRLHGIPVIVKDNIDVEGMATTCGDVARRNEIAKQDADVIKLLKAEGAIILAKSNLSEYAQYGYNSRSSLGGTVHNAYDTERTPAGSSGGTAVSVTCNFAAIGIGTDTASSIRRPSSFANLYGVRASFGKISQDGLYIFNEHKDTVGAMCRTAEDAALVTEILTGEKAGTYTESVSESGLNGKRIGYLANSFGYNVAPKTDKPLEDPVKLDKKIAPMVENSLKVLESGGAELVDASEFIPETLIYQIKRNDNEEGRAESRKLLTRILKDNKIDAVIYVSQTDVATYENLASTSERNNEAMYINIFSPVAGLPEIIVPMGLSETDPQNGYKVGLPLGMSFFSSYGNDKELFEIVCAFDKLSNTRYMPTTTPALADGNLESFVSELVADCQSIDEKALSQELLDDLKEALSAVKEGKIESPEYFSQVKNLAEVFDKTEREIERQNTQQEMQNNIPQTDSQREKNIYKIIFYTLAAVSVVGIGFGVRTIYIRAR